MELEEIKKNMSMLDKALDKTNSDFKISVSVSETAQAKILKKIRQAIINNSIIFIVFTCLWIGNVSPEKLPSFYKAFICVMCGVATLWYIFIYLKLKKINVATFTPTKLFSATTEIKILVLTGEIIFGIALVIFFTMLLTQMATLNHLAFYLIIATLSVGLVYSTIFFWPKYIRLFRELNSVK